MTSRRELLEAAAALAAARMTGPPGPARAETTAPLATDEDIDRILPAISNWGRWGPEDQLGTLNSAHGSTVVRHHEYAAGEREARHSE